MDFELEVRHFATMGVVDVGAKVAQPTRIVSSSSSDTTKPSSSFGQCTSASFVLLLGWRFENCQMTGRIHYRKAAHSPLTSRQSSARILCDPPSTRYALRIGRTTILLMYANEHPFLLCAEVMQLPAQHHIFGDLRVPPAHKPRFPSPCGPSIVLQLSVLMARTTQAPATTCAEHIALSSFFYQVPAPVTRNAVNPSSIDQENYVLPFSKERRLTEVLAFLAKTKDGPDYIPAVCVEQDLSGTSLDVILAINKSYHADGDELLQELKISFEEIFRLLNISQYDNSGVQRKVFASIISMCSPRVLCRLRLERKATKRPIHHLLKEAIFSIKRIHPAKLQNRQLHFVSSSFISEANKVIQLVDRWLKHQTLDELGVLVEGISHLQQMVPRLHHLLGLISNNHMDPSSRSSLLNIIRKVSRYWDTARHLYRTAKKFPLVRNMRVQLATLPVKAFGGQIDCSVFSDLNSCLSRHGFVKGQQDSVSQLCRNLKINEEAAHARYDRAFLALSAPKIHAEIQIVAFCEMQARGLFPRVVSSSKDACFLCNTFIQLHGRMHTLRSHGRLWPGWKLPILPQFTVLQQKFNERLLEDLHRNISAGLVQRKLHVHPLPSESNLLTLTASVTTQSMPELAAGTSHGETSSIESSTIVSNNPPKHGPSSAIGQISRIETPSDSSIDTVHLLEEEPVKDHLKSGRPFRLIITESIEVHLGLDDDSTSATTKEPLGYIIERLKADNTKYLSDTCPVVDVRQLEGEVLCPLSEENSFCLAAGDVVLKITTQISTKDK